MPQLYYGNGIARGISQAGSAIASGMQQRGLLAWQAEQKRLAKEAELEQYNRETGRQDRLLAEKKFSITQGLERRGALLRGGGVQTLGQFQGAMPTDPYAAEGYMTGGTPDLPTQQQRTQRTVDEQGRQLEGAQAWLIANDDPNTPGIQLNPAMRKDFSRLFPNLPLAGYERALQAANKAHAETAKAHAETAAEEALGEQRRRPVPPKVSPPKPTSYSERRDLIRTFEEENYNLEGLGNEINALRDEADQLNSGIDTRTRSLITDEKLLARFKTMAQERRAKAHRLQNSFDSWNAEVNKTSQEENDQIPSDWRHIGNTEDGAEVWEDTDGNRHKVER